MQKYSAYLNDALIKSYFQSWQRFDSLMSPEWNPPSTIPKDSPIRLNNSWKLTQEQTPPRTIKSHLPKELLPSQLWDKNPKVTTSYKLQTQLHCRWSKSLTICVTEKLSRIYKVTFYFR